MNTTFENCTLLDTKTWFEKAVPNPTLKNFSTQLGVHYEEVAESLEALKGNDAMVTMLLGAAAMAMAAVADMLKQNEHAIEVPEGENAELFLDALCDQIVTATGTGHMLGMDMVGAMTEVNRSNFSKFDEKGNPIFNENRKIMKGPNYSKPVLSPYLPQR